MSNSTFACNCKPILIGCPLKTTPFSGRKGFPRAYRRQHCAYRGRSSAPRHRSSSKSGFRTTHGTVSPSIVLWGTRAGPESECIGCFRNYGTIKTLSRITNQRVTKYSTDLCRLIGLGRPIFLLLAAIDKTLHCSDSGQHLRG